MSNIPFNKPFLTGNEVEYIQQALQQTDLAAGRFTDLAQQKLQEMTKAKQVLLTHSCTGALEMAALLCGISPGDEVIMPSYTFVSTANAFVLYGAAPVFVDIREDTLNLDENLVEAAITDKTKAIVAVNYAGVGCQLDVLRQIADKHGLMLIEDNAQGLLSTYQGKPLGSFGHVSTLSFHYTKNINSGLGGALIINDAELIDRAKIIQQKGTNREAFLEGKVDKYTWVDVGSSFMPSEITAAMLTAQLEQVETITAARMKVWQQYYEAFAGLEESDFCRRPVVPKDCQHNAHIFYLLMNDQQQRDVMIIALRQQGIDACFHFVPLHTSPAGQRFGRISGEMQKTEDLTGRIVRLPLYVGVGNEVERVVDVISGFLLEHAALSLRGA